MKIEILSEKPENTNLFNISVSKIKQFKNCKAAYKYAYIDKLPKKTWDFNVFGSFMHEVLETYHQTLIDHPDSKYNQVLKDCFWKAYPNYEAQLLSSDLWYMIENKDTREKVTYHKPFTPTQITKFKNDTFGLAGRYLALHGSQLKDGKAPQVSTVEQAFNLVLDDKILLNGFIDRVDLVPNGYHVLDYKSNQPRSRKYLADDLFQLQTYSYVLWVLNPNIEKIEASYLLLREPEKPIETNFEVKELPQVGENFLKQAELMQAEVGFKEEPGSLCRYCSFLDICKPGTEFVAEQDLNLRNRANKSNRTFELIGEDS